jgi:hypothetical protein
VDRSDLAEPACMASRSREGWAAFSEVSRRVYADARTADGTRYILTALAPTQRLARGIERSTRPVIPTYPQRFKCGASAHPLIEVAITRTASSEEVGIRIKPSEQTYYRMSEVMPLASNHPLAQARCGLRTEVVIVCLPSQNIVPTGRCAMAVGPADTKTK